MGFMDWWTDLHWSLRLGVALFFIAVSTPLFFFAHRFWPWGWAVGLVLLCFSGPSDSEKKGYRF